jgi:hypothetical protein
VKSVYVAKAINTIASIAFPSLLDLSVWHSCNQAPSLYRRRERRAILYIKYRPWVFHPHQTRSGENDEKTRGEEQRGCKWRKGFPGIYISKRHRAVTQFPFVCLSSGLQSYTHSMNSSSFAYTTTRRKETRKSRQKHLIAPYSSNDSRRRAYHLQKHFQNPLLLFTYWLGGLGRESFKQSKSN